MKTDRTSAIYSKYEYAFVLGLVLIWQIILIASSNGLFIETDSYTHALRLMDLIQSGSWQETLYMHDNCPYGQILHFTRITDVFLYLTTLPFLPFMDLKQAIVFGGFLYQPVMACLSAAALIRAGRAFCSPVVRLTGLLAYFFIFPETGYLFLAGRPDHHVLLNLFLILLSGSLTYGAKTQKTAYFKMAGVWGGLAVWTSPEGFLACLFLFAGMVLAWLAKYQNIRQIRLFSQFLFITTTLCWLVNPPIQGVLYPDNSRLSVLTVAVFGFAFTSFYIEDILKRKYIRSFFSRLSSLFLLTFFSFGFALFLFGAEAFLSSPISSELFDVWARYIAELQPAPYQKLIPFLSVFLIAFTTFFFAVISLKKLLLTNGIPFVLFTLSALISRRFCCPASVYAFFIAVFAVQILFNKLSFFRIVAPIWLIFIICLSIPSVLFLYHGQLFDQKMATFPQEAVPYLSEKSGCVLTHDDLGPETAWGTGKAVIGSPYHTNAQGLTDNYILFNSTDMARVQKLLKKRSVTTIIFPNPEEELKKIKNEIEKDTNKKNIFYKAPMFPLFEKMLIKYNDFCFLTQPLNMPEEIRRKYFIYHVDFDACEKNEE